MLACEISQSDAGVFRSIDSSGDLLVEYYVAQTVLAEIIIERKIFHQWLAHTNVHGYLSILISSRMKTVLAIDK